MCLQRILGDNASSSFYRMKTFCFLFLYINVKMYNNCYILLYSNYYATLRGRYDEEQKTMSTPWPTHKDIQLNRQLNKYVQNGTYTIRYYKWWKLFHICCQVNDSVFNPSKNLSVNASFCARGVNDSMKGSARGLHYQWSGNSTP